MLNGFPDNFRMGDDDVLNEFRQKQANFDLEEKRNESGGRYYPCELCEPGETGLVYLTQWGGKYHGRSDCPSIKRTVFIVPISEAGGRPPCRSCG